MPKRKTSRKRTTTYAVPVPGGILLRNGFRVVAVECNDPRCSCAPGEVTTAPLPRDVR
jgi:hypothetical protein